MSRQVSDAARRCACCGQPATESLAVRYRYPRAEPAPEAMDPYHVHGGAGFGSCGSPACEAAMLLACRAQVTASVRKFSDRELADSELDTVIIRPEQATYVGQPGGTVRHSWPTPPGEAI